MDVDPRKAAAKTVYQGQTYYFCSSLCKSMFDREPEKYIS
jgi:YHS domain-containing protein